jgi:hypothetical protein
MDIIASNKNNTLDPLSVIVKLFIYYHKPVGTKISIGNNRVYIQDIGIVQGLIRKINGDSKNDINILYCPILYACNLYLNKTNKTRFSDLFRNALKGLENMENTYTNTPIVYNIEAIVHLIKGHIDIEPKEKEQKEKEHKEQKDKEKKDLTPVQVPQINMLSEHIYQHLTTIWTPSRIDMLFSLISEIQKADNQQLKLLFLDALCKYMECIDTIVTTSILNLR